MNAAMSEMAVDSEAQQQLQISLKITVRTTALLSP